MTLNTPIEDLMPHYKADREAEGLKIKYLEMVAQRFEHDEK